MKPKYKKIADTYRHKIINRKNIKNGKLPSESELMKEFSVSRQTVRRALSELARMDLVEPRQGSGVYVKTPENRRLRIAFITFSLDTYIFPRIIRGISDELFTQNSDLLLYHTGYSVEKERSVLLSLEEIDGIIITPCFSFQGKTNKSILKKMDRSGIPVILLDNYFDTDSFSAVAIDDRAGGRTAAAELYRRGHRKITIFYGENHFGMIQRMEGAVAFLEENGLTRGEDIITCSSPLQNPGSRTEECVSTIISSGSTAVFCTNDQIAHAIIGEAEKRGIRIPESLSVIGFDNSELAAVSGIPFSSIAHPKAVSGKIAAQSVLNRIHAQEEGTQTLTLLRPRLVNRGSVRNR